MRVCHGGCLQSLRDDWVPRSECRQLRGAHIFVDETKDRDYLLVAAAVLARNLDDTRHAMREPRAARATPSRKRAIAAAICETAVTATIYDVGHRYRSELDARTACLRAVVADAAGAGAAALVLDRMTRCGGRTTSG